MGNSARASEPAVGEYIVNRLILWPLPLREVPPMLRCVSTLAVSLTLVAATAFAQDGSPTADQVKDALAKYKAERTEAAKTFKLDEVADAVTGASSVLCPRGDLRTGS